MKGNKDLVFDYYIPNPILGIPKNIEDIKDAEIKRKANVCILKQMESERKMKIKVEESIKLEDGKHKGQIEDVEYKSPKGFNYMDVVIKTKVKDKDVKIKASYPQNITENSALGKLLIRFGAKLEVDKELEPEEFLTKGKEVEFRTVTEGQYYNIVLDSVKPE